MADPEPTPPPPKEVQAEVVKPKKNRRQVKADSPKIKKFVKLYSEGNMTLGQAGLAARLGNNLNSATSTACVAMKTPEVLKMYRDELDRQKVSPKFIVKNIKKGIQKGKLTTSDRYLDIALRLQGVKDSKEPPAQTFVSVVLNSITERGLDL